MSSFLFLTAPENSIGYVHSYRTLNLQRAFPVAKSIGAKHLLAARSIKGFSPRNREGEGERERDQNAAAAMAMAMVEVEGKGGNHCGNGE